MNSLIWTVAAGRLTTEDDDVCQKCDSKPASHYVQLFKSIPIVSVLTINRIKVKGKSRIKINTPVFCDKKINFRGTTSDKYDEDNVYYCRIAAVLHYGSDIQRGHFVSYVFNSDHTATLYDDENVLVFSSEELLNFPRFQQNVYMSFYMKGDKWSDDNPSTIRYTENMTDVHWFLHKNEVKIVEKAWSHKKNVMCNNISSFDLNTVKPTNWLNGDVINKFLLHLCDESRSNGILIHSFSSYLFNVLQNKVWKHSMVRSSLAVDPMDLDIIFFPLNINDVQWALMVCYPKSLLLCYYDSLLNINVSAFSNIIGFLSAAFKLHGHSVNLTDWMLIAPDRIPCQQDSSSCGVYACMNALYSIRPTAHVHSAKDINNIRFWLVHLLLTSNRNSISRKKDYRCLSTRNSVSPN